MPVVAECAGLLWLGASLDGRDQCGVLPARARMTGTLHLGYREATPCTTPLAAAGTRVRAHEFHRTVSDPTRRPPAWELADGSRHGWAAPACSPPTSTCTVASPAPRPGWSGRRWRPDGGGLRGVAMAQRRCRGPARLTRSTSTIHGDDDLDPCGPGTASSTWPSTSAWPTRRTGCRPAWRPRWPGWRPTRGRRRLGPPWRLGTGATRPRSC